MSRVPPDADEPLGSAGTPDPGISRMLVEHYSLLYALALARLKDRDAAEDLVQEVFVRALARRDWPHDEQGRLPWFICVTRNLATDWVRRKQAFSRVVQELSSHVSVPANRSHSETAGERLMRREQDCALDDALANLPVDQRELVLLHYMEGYTRRDIASKLGAHPATVGRRLDAALLQLRRALEPELQQRLAFQKPKLAGAARAGALLTAFSCVGAESRGQLLASVAWREGDAVIAKAGAMVSAPNSLNVPALTTAATIGKGVAVVSKGKIVGAVVLGVLLVGSAGVVGVKRYVGNLHRIPVVSTVSGLASPASQGDPLPPLPPGWRFEAVPSRSDSPLRTMFGRGIYDSRGLDLTNALNNWKTDARVIDPAVRQDFRRYDVKVAAPGAASDDEMNKVMRVEMQRLFKFRAVVESRRIPALVLKCSGGKPASLRSAGGPVSVSYESGREKLRGVTMEMVAQNIAANRKMPAFDETGIVGRYDIDIPGKLTDQTYVWSDESLRKLGLDIVHEDRDAPVLFVSPEP